MVGKIMRFLESARFGSHAQRLAGQVDAINRSLAVIEFSLDGIVQDANENFLGAIGYALDEIKGKHHRMFCAPRYAESSEYREFWARLRRGEFDSGEYPRIAKGGREIWIQASYTPVLDARGRPVRVVKFATDITARKLKSADDEGKIAAIGKSQAVIEFNVDGTILDANRNFLSAVGYSIEEIRGRHHRIFCAPEYAESAEYRAFWAKLGSGQYDAGQYLRVGKDGRQIWIQASYNPILDPQGRPIKVVKFATDITAQKEQFADFSGQLAAIDKAQAVIEFDLDGTIRTANENFLRTVGYSLAEIKGRHHRMFCEPSYAGSEEYAAFWRKLGSGQFDAGQYLRLGKGGKEIWIQATYNPILDSSGRPVKVVKFATDVTAQRQMLDTMKRIVAEVQQAAASIHAGAQEISLGNDDLSQRTQEQAASLEETAASMNEMTSTVRGNADNAAEADRLASAASVLAEKGGRTVGQAVEAMSAISQSSRRVEDVVGVIDDIAFQINLLALNAAVEAARAGEQGRGFAVVAAEVRSLAGRSANAAKEVKELIGDSVRKVADGSRLVDESGRTLEEIVTGVRRLSALVTEIASASREQSKAIEQVNTAVAQMDGVTQQNAALVEQASAASKTILNQAESLNLTVAGVDLGEALNSPSVEDRPAGSRVAANAVPLRRIRSA